MPSACVALCSAASAAALDLRGAQRPGGATVDEKEDAAEVDGGNAAAGEGGGGLAKPDSCRIGIAPWTEISTDMTGVGGLAATSEPMGPSRCALRTVCAPVDGP
jgi:hypothetical protein